MIRILLDFYWYSNLKSKYEYNYEKCNDFKMLILLFFLKINKILKYILVNILDFKFDNRSIYSNIKVNNTQFIGSAER